MQPSEKVGRWPRASATEPESGGFDARSWESQEALNCATNADEFKLRVAGVRSVSDQAREEMERTRRRTGTGGLDANRPETKQFVNWLLEGTEQVTR